MTVGHDNDLLKGLTGNDELHGEDILSGGTGHDTLMGGGGG